MKDKVKHLKEKLANGVSPAMATPLEIDSYSVNIAVIPQLVDFLLAKGVKGLFVGGTTGEGILLDMGERKRLHEVTAATVNGRVPVLVHIGAQRNDTAVDLAQHAASIDADAIVAVPPYFYGMHDDGLAAYFQAIAEAVPDLPLFGYDIPHMAINGIGPDLAARLCEIIPSMAGFKSSNTSARAVGRLVEAVPDERIVLAGNESIALGSLALGADGLISGLSTALPEPFVAMTQAFADGEIEEARRQQRLINQLLTKIPNGERLGAIKSVLTSRGIPVGTTSPVLPSSNPEIWVKMQVLLSL
jgi:dihydrodipicolinate synthase/N-acetylneuraminate lyase